MTKRQNDKMTKRQKDKMTKWQKKPIDKNTKQKLKDKKWQSLIYWCQGSFALLRCFNIWIPVENSLFNNPFTQTRVISMKSHSLFCHFSPSFQFELTNFFAQWFQLLSNKIFLKRCPKDAQNHKKIQNLIPGSHWVLNFSSEWRSLPKAWPPTVVIKIKLSNHNHFTSSFQLYQDLEY